VKKVLIVDDSATMRTQLTGASKRSTATTASPSWEQHPDTALVISDVNMPWKNGFEMLAEIRASSAAFASVAVIMLTTEGNPEEIKKAKEMGIKGWMIKPFKPDALRQVVTKLIA
jgi:two-component system chemotaxis response regulator CheY